MPAEEPVYKVIMADIRRKIASGELKPGDKLPSIRQMRDIYDCSDEPIKTALRTLSALNVVTGHQGRGTFVTRTGSDGSLPAAPIRDDG